MGMSKPRKFRMTLHMAGILVIVNDGYKGKACWLTPTALVRLASEGYLTVGRKVRLTPSGKALLPEASRMLEAHEREVENAWAQVAS